MARVVSLLQERPLLVSPARGDCVEEDCEEGDDSGNHLTARWRRGLHAFVLRRETQSFRGSDPFKGKPVYLGFFRNAYPPESTASLSPRFPTPEPLSLFC